MQWLYNKLNDDRGAFGIIMMGHIFPLALMVALVLNTGTLLRDRMRVQAAADAAAFSTASWNARSTNLIAATNRVVIRTASAQWLAAGSPIVAYKIGKDLYDWFKIGSALVKSVFPPTVAAGVAILAKVAQEAIVLADFVLSTAPSTLRAATLHFVRKSDDIGKFQENLVKSTPSVVDTQRKQLESMHKVKLAITPGRSKDEYDVQLENGPPVMRDFLQSTLPFYLHYLWGEYNGVGVRGQVYADSRGWDRGLRSIHLGRGQKHWRDVIGNVPGQLANALLFIDDTHCMVTQTIFPPSEVGSFALSLDGLKDFLSFPEEKRIKHLSYIATARAEDSPHRMWQALGFRKEQQPVEAFAQAEIFNGKASWEYEIIASGFDIFNSGFNMDLLMNRLKPWRVWTMRGMYWQPRLSFTDGYEYRMFMKSQLFSPTFRKGEGAKEDPVDAILHH